MQVIVGFSQSGMAEIHGKVWQISIQVFVFSDPLVEQVNGIRMAKIMDSGRIPADKTDTCLVPKLMEHANQSLRAI